MAEEEESLGLHRLHTIFLLTLSLFLCQVKKKGREEENGEEMKKIEWLFWFKYPSKDACDLLDHIQSILVVDRP